MPTVHKLKIAPNHFQSVKSEKKNFECRKDDRNYKVGDELLLHEFKATKLAPDGEITGQVCHRKVTYILREFEGLKDGFVILGIEKV